jgi:hypothetical protein
MANSNFIVHNGLTVGAYTVFAGNGDIITSGNVTTTGSGSINSANGFGGLNPASIYNGSSNVSVTASAVFANISGTNQMTVNSSGVTIVGNLTVQGTQTTVYNETATGSIIPSANLSYNIGSTTAWWNVIYGNTFQGRSTTALYADLAENYQSDKAYLPGTVVMFGGSAEVTVADADTTAVAGVVSTNPAHLMNGGLTGTNIVPLALQGRVPCQVIGPVHKGDLMVSAGHGFAKVNNTPAVGTVIGKALQEVTFAGKAVIEVVVGRV